MKKYTQKKIKNQELLKYIVKHVTEKTFDRINFCGSWLGMIADDTFEKIKLHTSNFCKDRFCPMCAWRLAKKDALKIAILMLYLEQEYKKEFILLTLTASNVKANELGEEIKKYNKNFKKLMERKEVNQITKGYIRKLEITYDKYKIITKELYERKEKYYIARGLKIGDPNPTFDTYHTHFHVTIAVNKSYFTQTTQYIKQERWLKMWRESMNDNSITQVDVRKIRKNNQKEIMEMAKYSAKDADYLVSQEVFDTFYKALRGKQVLTYSGLFADAHKLYKSKKLDYLKQKDTTEYVYWLLYRWGKGEYVEAECRELTEYERKQINKQLIEEVDVED